MKPNLPKVNLYTAKDQTKWDKANKFIGKGTPGSSTEQYRIALGPHANCGVYTSTDIVFVSVNGNRRNRVRFDKNELLLAIKAKVIFITDTPYDRNREYNIGEREVAAFLSANGYAEVSYGVWWSRSSKELR